MVAHQALVLNFARQTIAVLVVAFLVVARAEGSRTQERSRTGLEQEAVSGLAQVAVVANPYVTLVYH